MATLLHQPFLPAHPQPALAQWSTEHEDDEDDEHDVAPAQKSVRRRSSKACDQCRKSKCKCERTSPNEPCKSCVLLGTQCTFLGPSRKRGPPKGYIDAIEARLHQMEALIGTLLFSEDSRARSLLADLSQDPLARDILDRVDESPFGTKGRTQEDRASRVMRTSSRRVDAPYTTPSLEWQNHLRQRLRQRRRLTPPEESTELPTSPLQTDFVNPLTLGQSSGGEDSDAELPSALGQLSLNEDSQIRYHSKVSGLHIVGQLARFDERNAGGIWRFPKAGVWPQAADAGENTIAPSVQLPPRPHLVLLLELYFAYVHPVLPMLIPAAFWRSFYEDASAEPLDPLLLLSMISISARYSVEHRALPPAGRMWSAGDDFLDQAKRLLNDAYASSRPSTCQALLLLAYRQIGIGAMAQAWLYLGMAIRMAQDLGLHRFADNWTYSSQSQHVPGEVPKPLFSAESLQVRKRTWYACVVMDKYVSTYIGRPLSIFERDADAGLPAEIEEEEMSLWERHPSAGPTGDPPDIPPPTNPKSAPYVPVPTRNISCFNASAQLSHVLSAIVETIYCVRPVQHRHAAAATLDRRLDRWYVTLPDHLRLVDGESRPPHVLTLHMGYWCSVLLLHRPFMKRKLGASGGCPHEEESCHKSFDLCHMAAGKISSIVARYMESFCVQRCPAFLTYYVFSASIMHMTTLSIRPIDVQALQGLQQCMDALKKMTMVWPSAGRAWELVNGAKIDMRAALDVASIQQHDPNKSPSPTSPSAEKRKREEAFDGREHPEHPFSIALQPPHAQALLLPASANSPQSFERWSATQPPSPMGGAGAITVNGAGHHVGTFPTQPGHDFYFGESLSLYGLPMLGDSGSIPLNTFLTGVEGDDQPFGALYAGEQ